MLCSKCSEKIKKTIYVYTIDGEEVCELCFMNKLLELEELGVPLEDIGLITHRVLK